MVEGEKGKKKGGGRKTYIWVPVKVQAFYTIVLIAHLSPSFPSSQPQTCLFIYPNFSVV